jgi:hypothetical protein
MATNTPCRHDNLAPKKHSDGLARPACTNCGIFVVRGALHIVIPLSKVGN